MYQVCYTRYQVSFYLWWIGSELKYCKVPKYCDQDYSSSIHYRTLNMIMDAGEYFLTFSWKTIPVLFTPPCLLKGSFLCERFSSLFPLVLDMFHESNSKFIHPHKFHFWINFTIHFTLLGSFLDQPISPDRSYNLTRSFVLSWIQMAPEFCGKLIFAQMWAKRAQK